MTQTATYEGPLVGLKVIDFGHYYAGPLAGMLLADQGATVIRIIRPGERELPDQQFRLFNRNKKLLELDLKNEDDKAQALSLIGKADVVIENFRPGVMKRLGLDYASVKEANPGLIYLSLPGFASNDTARAHIPAWEGVMGAAACLFSEISPIARQLNAPPVYTSMPHCSVYGALHGVIATTAALLAREEHGVGTVIEAPLVEAALSGLPLDFVESRVGSIFPSISELMKPFEYQQGDSLVTRQDKLEKAWDVGQQMTIAHSQYLTCGDGRKLVFHGGLFAHKLQPLLKALGIDHQLKKEGFVNLGPWETDLDNNLSVYGGLSPERAKRLEELVREALKTKKAEELEELLAEKTLIGLVRTREEWMSLEPMLRTGVLVKMNNGNSELTVPGRAADLSGPDGALMSGFSEMEIITKEEAGTLFPDTARSKKAGGATLKKGDLLKGVKVLDMANILAGPTATYFLAQYGADIIKLDQVRNVPHLLKVVLEANQGKRSMVGELSTAPGQEVLHRLVSQVDVVMHNILDDTAERLGVTHEQLRAVNSNVVSCQLSHLGGSLRGGWENRQGVDGTTQTVNGISTRYGSLERPVLHSFAPTADITSALGLAFSALLGIWQQRKTGYAGEGRTSLGRMLNYYQLPWMISENGNSEWGEARGQFAVGETGWQRLYQCQDGWIYVGATADEASKLAEVVSGTTQFDEQALEAGFINQDCAYWAEKLNAAGIGCHRVLTIHDYCAPEKVRSIDNTSSDEIAAGPLEVMVREDHPCGQPIVTPLPAWVRVGEQHSYKRLAVAPRYGQHSRDILSELGYNEEEINRLISLGVVHEYLPVLGGKEAFLYPLSK